jgi:hypothetical protein
MEYDFKRFEDKLTKVMNIFIYECNKYKDILQLNVTELTKLIESGIQWTKAHNAVKDIKSDMPSEKIKTLIKQYNEAVDNLMKKNTDTEVTVGKLNSDAKFKELQENFKKAEAQKLNDIKEKRKNAMSENITRARNDAKRYNAVEKEKHEIVTTKRKKLMENMNQERKKELERIEGTENERKTKEKALKERYNAIKKEKKKKDNALIAEIDAIRAEENKNFGNTKTKTPEELNKARQELIKKNREQANNNARERAEEEQESLTAACCK